MKNTIVYLEANGKNYPMVFNLNVMEEIQDKYGSLDKWGALTQGDGEPRVKELKYGITAMINEGIDIENENNGTNVPMLTEKHVGRLMTEVGIETIVEKIREITIASTKGEEKNVQSTKMKIAKSIFRGFTLLGIAFQVIPTKKSAE